LHSLHRRTVFHNRAHIDRFHDGLLALHAKDSRQLR